MIEEMFITRIDKFVHEKIICNKKISVEISCVELSTSKTRLLITPDSDGFIKITKCNIKDIMSEAIIIKPFSTNVILIK